MNSVKRAFQRLRAKTRGLISRRGDGDGATPEDGGGEVRKSGAPRQLASLGIALIVSVAVFAGLTLCETGAIYGMPPFGLSCARGSQIAANLSVAAGVGFLVFLLVEVSGMVFAQLFQDRRDEAAERRAATAELKAEIAKLALRLEAAEQSRRADDSRAGAQSGSRRTQGGSSRASGGLPPSIGWNRSRVLKAAKSPSRRAARKSPSRRAGRKPNAPRAWSWNSNWRRETPPRTATARAVRRPAAACRAHESLSLIGQ